MSPLRIAALLVALASSSASAESRWKLSAEADPLAYAMQGYSLHVHARPAGSHLRVGLAAFGTGNEKIAGFLADAVFAVNGSRTANAGWTFGINEWAFETFYDFSPGKSSPYLGAYIIDVHAFGDADDGSHMTSQQLAVLPAAGYRWYPRHGMFLAGWAGFGALSPAFAKHETGARRFEAQHLYPIATIHLGVEL